MYYKQDLVSTEKIIQQTHTAWPSLRVGIVAAIGAPALAALIVGFIMPRGPVTTLQALLVMAIGLITGLTVGLTLRSWWALLLAPLVYGLVFELARMGVSGPLVDAPNFDTTYGILALIIGRGMHALLALLPMIFGVAYGIAITRWPSASAQTDSGFGRYFGYGGIALLTILFIALVVIMLLPASTPPIVGSDGEPLPDSIATLEQVRLGDHDQWISIRGKSTDNPVLLYLSGGPGQSDLAYSRVLFEDLTNDFIVVGWDQRGTGKSYPALDPVSTLTMNRAIADTTELSEYLRDRFDEEKIYLMGESYGSFLGVLTVERHPELYHAFIGSGQMVDPLETTERLHQDMLAYAVETGDDELAAQMQAFGQPPYRNAFANAFVMGYYDALTEPYTPPQAYIEKGEASGIGPWGILGSEYNFMEKLGVLRGLMDLFSVMWPQMLDIDFRENVTNLDVPVYIFEGEQELAARSDLVLKWLDVLEAPEKRLYTFENAGHSVVFEHFEEVSQILSNTVLPETYAQP